jgi:hypothetical protein
LSIARKEFKIPNDLQDLTITSIILHDVGGPTIKDQYEKGPALAAALLRQVGCNETAIRQICQIVGAHHDHPNNPTLPFRVLFDSDKLVMLAREEYPGYAANLDFDWNKIISLLYSQKAKKLAREMLHQRRREQCKPEN